jgi:hypothetical protein
MTVSELQKKYEEVFKEPTTARNKQYLWKKIAWRIQELKYGGLSERAKRRAREIADEHDIRIRPPRGAFRELDKTENVKRNYPKGNGLPAAGTILTRDYKGQVIEVEVLEKGFRFGNQVYRSLSAIAREITGTHWNGKVFFGIKK